MNGEELPAEGDYGMRKSCSIWSNWVIVIAVMVMSSTQAEAFYWYGWPGSGVPPERTIGPPGSSGSTPRVPTGLPDQTGSGPPGGGGPHSTPEPATGLAAIVGLGAIFARGMRRGSQKTKNSHG